MAIPLRAWKRWLTIALAGLMVPAVPVSALTFLSPWHVAQTKMRKGAPAATFDTTFGDGETLLVDMGRTSSRGARSRVEATREFHVDSGERINITHVFETLLNDARLKVKMKISPQKGFKIDTVRYDDTGGSGQIFGMNMANIGRLPPGDYFLKIKIDYKNRDGKWDNSLPRPGSPHTFSIQSL